MDARRDSACGGPRKGVVPTLQSLLLEGITVGIAAKDDRFTTEALSTLSPDLTELLQHQLIAKNALDDYSLVMTTSTRQTSLNLPFSMTDEDKSLSPVSILLAITVRTSPPETHSSQACPPFPPLPPLNSHIQPRLFDGNSRAT